MNSSILADESVSGHIIKSLRNMSIDLFAVVEINPGISDPEVISLTKKYDAILITEDKDFGEWVFSHKIEGFSVIFVRYQHGEEFQIARAIKQILTNKNTFPINKEHHFITVGKTKVRSRTL